MEARRRVKAEINIVPYVDVLLVLLIIFMAVADPNVKAMLKLPSVDHVQSSTSEVVIVWMKSESGFEVSRGGHSMRASQLQDVRTQIAGLNREKQLPVVINADRNLTMEHVSQVMSALQFDGYRVGLGVSGKK